MKKDKIVLTEKNRSDLRVLRKEAKKAAEDVSVELGFSKAWLGRLERGVLQTVRQSDLAELLSKYLPDKSPNFIISSGILDNFLESGLLIGNQDKYLVYLKDLSIPEAFFKCIELGLFEERQKKTFENIEYFIKCIEEYPDFMSVFFSNAKSLHSLLESYTNSTPVRDRFYYVASNDLASELSNVINKELEKQKHHSK